MPNLDVKYLRYMCSDEFRVLTACEMGMKNHELVPSPLIESISGLKRGGAFKFLKLLCKNKLVAHQSIPYDSYRLTFKGYDYLALKTMSKRGTLASMGIQVGVGKESDIFTVCTQEGVEACIKLHRLGRNCFRTVKTNRDYIRPGQHASWLYLSRLSALKEYAFMTALHAKGFPVPTPIDVNRHCLVMSLSMGFQLNSIQELRHPGKVFDTLMQLICRLASYGLIHCDFNEFNLLVDDEERVTLIDFPQMVSTSHPNAEYYFNRDVECVRTFFRRRFHFQAAAVPNFTNDVMREHDLDVDLAASGWTTKANSDFEKLQTLLDDVDEGEGEGEGGFDAELLSADDSDEIQDEERDMQAEVTLEEEVIEGGGLRGAEEGTAECRVALLSENVCGEEEEDAALRELELNASRLWSAGGVAAVTGAGQPDCSGMPDGAHGAAAIDGVGCGSTQMLGAKDCDDGTVEPCSSCCQAASVPSGEEDGPGTLEAVAVVRGNAGDGTGGGGDLNTGQPMADKGKVAYEEVVEVDTGETTPCAVNKSRAPRGVPVGTSDPLVADRVKRELRRKKSARPTGKGSRNEQKDREKRKLVASTKREASGFSGW